MRRLSFFALVLAVGTGILCSLAPAFAALRTSPTQGLKEGAGTGTGASKPFLAAFGAGSFRNFRGAGSVGRSSGAFLRSFQKDALRGPGFRSDHVLAAEYQLPPKTNIRTTLRWTLLTAPCSNRLAAKPGVTSVGLTGTPLPSSQTIRPGHLHN